MKIALIPNFEKTGTKDLLLNAIKILSDSGAECFVPESIMVDCKSMPDNLLYENCDIVITIGGDGTLIKHAKAASRHEKSCLGINTGRLGFLANLEKDQLGLLEKLVSGDFSVESRMMLSVKAVKNGLVVCEDIALNDAVISSGAVSKMTDISLNVSGDGIEYVADGVIFSTPTGSTAYSMSAGGPIIDPEVRCITVTPICSHSLTARPILANEFAQMRVGLKDSSRTKAILTVDGKHCCEVDFDTQIYISRCPFDAKLINVSDATIYKTISKKF